VHSFVLQVETQNNQLKAAIPVHFAPELGDGVSASWSNNIGRPTIDSKFSALHTDEFQCINHDDFIFEHYPSNNCEMGARAIQLIIEQVPWVSGIISIGNRFLVIFLVFHIMVQILEIIDGTSASPTHRNVLNGAQVSPINTQNYFLSYSHSLMELPYSVI